MSKKILKLDFENEYEFLLGGIICAYKDYKLCFELNRIMKLNFVRNKDVFVPAGKLGSTTRHSYFSCPGKDNNRFHVISNRDKDSTGFFIPEMRNIDYFLLVSDAPASLAMNSVLKTVKNIDIVSGVFEIAPSEVKSADAFLLFLEA